MISLTNHESVYDIPTLIKAVKLVESEDPGLNCKLAGNGTQTNDLVSLVRKEKLDRCINIFPILSQDVHLWLQKSKVYVSTALSDAGLSSSTAEAMACGLPVIVTDVAENKKWVCTPKQRESIQFQLFKPGDHEELARRIRFFLRYPKIAEAQGKINRSIIFSYNNYETDDQDGKTIRGGLLWQKSSSQNQLNQRDQNLQPQFSRRSWIWSELT